jgi:hypothetical protein
MRNLMARRAAIAAALLLAACCSNDDRDCTTDDLAVKNARRQWVEQHTTTPELISEQDGVKLYRIWTLEPQARDHWTYFTTPCGDVRGTVEWTERHGKASSTYDLNADTAGSGCKQCPPNFVASGR